jgi:hypothetical protein
MGLVARPDRQDSSPAPDSRRPVRVPPLRPPPELDTFEGKWVAVAGSRVVASADTSHELGLKLRKMEPEQLKNVVMQYVHPPTDSYVVYAR